MGAATHFDDHRLRAANRRPLAQDLAAEDRVGAALEQALLARPHAAARRLERQARSHAAAGRATVDLAAGEDADIAAPPAAAPLAPIGQDRSVEETGSGIVGMLHGARPGRRPPAFPPGLGRWAPP